MTNFIRYLLTVAFKFTCWLLITGSLSSFNIFLGLFFCVILPPGSYKDLKIKPILPEIFKSLSLPFLMIKESIELMLIKNPTDHFVVENASKFASKGSNFAGFFGFVPNYIYTDVSCYPKIKCIGMARSYR